MAARTTSCTTRTRRHPHGRTASPSTSRCLSSGSLCNIQYHSSAGGLWDTTCDGAVLDGCRRFLFGPLAAHDVRTATRDGSAAAVAVPLQLELRVPPALLHVSRLRAIDSILLRVHVKVRYRSAIVNEDRSLHVYTLCSELPFYRIVFRVRFL